MPKKSHDPELEQIVNKSLKVSSYIDQIYDKLYEHKDIQPDMVPNFNPDAGMQGGLSNESGSLFGMFDDSQSLKTVLGAIDMDITTVLESSPSAPTVQSQKQSKNAIKISQNQLKALQKYPSLVELLGTDQGTLLVKDLVEKLNVSLISQIEDNTKEISKFAQVCVTEKHNIKHYFVGENQEWVCVVTASGPFRGTEAFLYNPDADKAYILRKHNDDYQDVSAEFNIIHESEEKLC